MPKDIPKVAPHLAIIYIDTGEVLGSLGETTVTAVCCGQRILQTTRGGEKIVG